MPDFTFADLSKYRLQKAHDMLDSAQRDYDAGDFSSSNNRAYYSIFHAMRAVLALDGLDFKKHSMVISTFTQRYIKSDFFDRSFGTLINSASLIRNRSDYEDFYTCSLEDSIRLLDGAREFLSSVSTYLKTP